MSHESEQLVATAFHHMRAARKSAKRDAAADKIYAAIVARLKREGKL